MPFIRRGTAKVSDYNAARRLVRRIKANDGTALILRQSTKRGREREVFFVLRDGSRITDAALGIVDGVFNDAEG